VSDQEALWKERHASAGAIARGRHGKTSGLPGIEVELRLPALMTVIAAKRREADVAKTLMDSVQAAPSASRFVRGTCDVIWSGPGQWLVAAPDRNTIAALAMKLAGSAALTDQTDGRVMLRISGARVRDVLAKGCPIDLHPRAFKAGDVALTSISHIGVQIWQVDDGPTFDMTLPRSMLESFWSWFDASAAEYGYVVK
jgi:sarcosine oxidase subunit gamma